MWGLRTRRISVDMHALRRTATMRRDEIGAGEPLAENGVSAQSGLVSLQMPTAALVEPFGLRGVEPE
jgi:hypothetical protein